MGYVVGDIVVLKDADTLSMVLYPSLVENIGIPLPTIHGERSSWPLFHLWQERPCCCRVHLTLHKTPDKRQQAAEHEPLHADLA